MYKQYSVLMSVYKKERPEYLMAALNSICSQTLPPGEIVLVCDGVLTEALERVVASFEKHLRLVRLPENMGLGRALAEGLLHCSYEWVARMDSDDIASQYRCERQLAYVRQYPEVDVLSGTVAEFSGDALTETEAVRSVFSYKHVPAHMQEIRRYIQYRNPINHPCVLFRRSKVLEAGSYQPCDLFEDYDLWVRMFQQQCVFANLTDTILYMRVNGMHKRRGGIRYVRAITQFWLLMYHRNMIALPQYIGILVPRVIVSLMPNWIRRWVYDKILRNH